MLSIAYTFATVNHISYRCSGYANAAIVPSTSDSTVSLYYQLRT